MLKNDGSIDKIEEDKLNRKDFIERIIEGILGYKDTDSLVIGLEGNWGSGKTSILNIIEKELEKQKVEVFKFNPWNFSIRKQLASDFFEQFSLFLGSRSNVKESLKEVSKSLMKIAYILKPMTTIGEAIPVVNNVGKIVKGIKKLGKSYEKISDIIDLESIKKGVEKALGDGDGKIIIFIDDLDRLLDSEICEVLQFVKGIGDLKNVIYILAYDKEIVINSLDKVTSKKGDEYLKKIIQIQMELPIMTSTKISFLFKDEIENLFHNEISEMNEFEMEYFCEVLEELLIKLPKNVRDLKRVMNNIRFSLKKSKNLNITDYIFIKTLEVTNYSLYKYIKNNKNNLVVSTKVGLKDIIDLEKVDTENREIIKKILEIIFEKRREEIPTSKEIECRVPKRICNNAYFYNYFGEELSLNIITKDVQDKMISINIEKEFVDYLSEITELEIITEVVLNTSEFIFYQGYQKTRAIHLINLLEKYIINRKKTLDNTIILKNKIREILEEDKQKGFNNRDFEVKKLNVDTPISIKLLLNVLHREDEIEHILQKYILKTMKKDDSIIEYISYLKEKIEDYSEVYYLALIYNLENGEEIIRKNKDELLVLKDKILEKSNQNYSYSKTAKEIMKILQE